MVNQPTSDRKENAYQEQRVPAGEAQTTPLRSETSPPKVGNGVPLQRILGLVGYNCDTGLGELNRQIATYCPIAKWLVRPHPKKGTNPSLSTLETLVCDQNQSPVVDEFVRSVDVVLFCERPYYSSLPNLCGRYGKTLVCVPMLEWTPYRHKADWLDMCDLFVCPTSQCYNTLNSEGLPCIYFPWPVDTNKFKFQQRETCSRFLFVNGNGGWGYRKGAPVMEKALSLLPEMPLLTRSQVGFNTANMTRTVALPREQDNSVLYSRGDVLVSPHSVDGIGLEPMEAMACGMPVISTDGEPWNEIPSLAKIEATVTKRTVMRDVVWYLPDPVHLAKTCRRLLGANIREASRAARYWAEVNSWDHRASDFLATIMRGCVANTASR